jgi:hypothetical protein
LDWRLGGPQSRSGGGGEEKNSKKKKEIKNMKWIPIRVKENY